LCFFLKGAKKGKTIKRITFWPMFQIDWPHSYNQKLDRLLQSMQIIQKTIWIFQNDRYNIFQ
ncbi:MAG: hypothetical protein SPI87_08810, partial [Anaerobutyricum sp.]|nr:hypothetical protein [Anaerobutyricum sp.]